MPSAASLAAMLATRGMVHDFRGVTCGSGRGEAPAFAMDIERVPGYCERCEAINGPTAQVCGMCGAPLASAERAAQLRATYLSHSDASQTGAA